MHWSSDFRLIDYDYIFSIHAVSLRCSLLRQNKYCAIIFVMITYNSLNFLNVKFLYADTQCSDGKRSHCSFGERNKIYCKTGTDKMSVGRLFIENL